MCLAEVELLNLGRKAEYAGRRALDTALYKAFDVGLAAKLCTGCSAPDDGDAEEEKHPSDLRNAMRRGKES